MMPVDWLIIAAYLAGSLAIGLYFARRAGRSMQEFFLGGRSMPWWLAGLSMVATTFAADTPLAVTELVATRGISGNWLWWNMVIGGMLTVFFFARLWRRAGVLTDLEFIELRYSGRPAAFLRGFRSLYLGLFMNTVIMGWVNVAMATVLVGMFGIPASEVFWYVALAMLITAVYSSLSGLWGVAVTDAFQFVMAMAGCIILAVIVVESPEIGGLSGLRMKLPEGSLDILPHIGSVSSGATTVLSLSAGAFFAYVGVQWWSSWYPGAEPGGGGYIAQRMMSTRNERHSIYAVLFFQIAHYCLRPWPWILVGLCAIVLYPDLPAADKKLGYIRAMNDFLPSGLKGLMVAAFFAAYMSTIATHLNWGTSYLVHDLWRRFIRPGGDERSYVAVSRVTTIVIMLLSLAVTSVITSISGAWQFLLECGAGLGLVLILRWYWWRINAWSEIVATITPVVVFTAITLWNLAYPDQALVFPDSLFLIVGVTTAAWLTATWLTPPVDDATLDRFYTTVRPGGALWHPVAARHPHIRSEAHMGRLAIAWIAAVVLVYAVLFSSGALFFGSTSTSLLWALLGCAAAIVVHSMLRSTTREEIR
jgi:solute:Na+ symporter, SSS family